MCRLMLLSRNAHYDHLPSSDYSEKQYHEEILEMVRCITNSAMIYVSCEIGKALNGLDYPAVCWETRSLMQDTGVQAIHRKKNKVSTNRKHKQPLFDNKLNRQVWVWSLKSGLCSAITLHWDPASLLVFGCCHWLGWFMMHWKRWPDGINYGASCAFGTDAICLQGLAEACGKIDGLVGSMVRTGDCFDNAMAKNFFGSFKQDRIHWRALPDLPCSSARWIFAVLSELFYHLHIFHIIRVSCSQPVRVIFRSIRSRPFAEIII